jgi:hypothetical protein
MRRLHGDRDGTRLALGHRSVERLAQIAHRFACCDLVADLDGVGVVAFNACAFLVQDLVGSGVILLGQHPLQAGLAGIENRHLRGRHLAPVRRGERRRGQHCTDYQHCDLLHCSTPVHVLKKTG